MRSTAFMGYVPKKKVGIILLANASAYPVSQIGPYGLALMLGEDPEKLPFIKMEPPYDEFKDFVDKLWEWWDEHGRNRERVGELIQRLGMRDFLEAVGVEPDPRMINTPRYNPYIFFKEDEVEGGWTRDVAEYRKRHQA